MDALLFSIKRTFHCSLRFSRERLGKNAPITPARLDMLYAIYRGNCLQLELRETLGVSGAVVSRMLKSLERLGLVRRSRFEDDRRCRWIDLTFEGIRAVQERVAAWFDSKEVHTALRRILFDDTKKRGRGRAVATFSKRLEKLRSAFGDRGELWSRPRPHKIPKPLPRAA